MKNPLFFFPQKTYAAICSLFVIVLVILCAKNTNAATFTWTENDPIENIKGYNIYYSTQSSLYDPANHMDVGNVTSCDIEETFAPLLQDGTEYFFVITAYTCTTEECTADTIIESDFSDNEVAFTYIAETSAPTIDSDNVIDLLDDDVDGDGIVDGEDSSPAAAVTPLFTSTSYPDGAAVKGKISYDHNWQPLQHNGNFHNPVVIAGPATHNDPTAGVIRLQNISANSFEIKFQEGQYVIDQGLGSHGLEESSYLVIEDGVHKMADGSSWEAGTFTLSAPAVGIQWETIHFSSTFPATPYLFLTIQSNNDEKPIIIRAKSLNESNFQAAIFTEEALTEAHAIEKIGYLAIYSPTKEGELYTDTTSSPYHFDLAQADHNFISIFSREIFLQEEQSENDETRHVLEQINALQIGLDFFAQIITCNGYDPITIRQRQRPSFYSNTTISDKWRTVHTPQALSPPVVILGPPSYNDTDPGVIRLCNITDNSFDIKFQEWNYLYAKDGKLHELENNSWLAMAPGRYHMEDGSIWEIGKFSLGGTGNLYEVTFSESFSEPPALFLTMQTYNGSDAVTVRADQVTNQDFRAALFEEEANMGSGHVTETVGYLAIYSPNSYGTATIGEQKIPYSIVFTEADNMFSAISDYEIALEEEQSYDIETSHMAETLNILSINNTIFAQDISSFGSNPISIRHNPIEDLL